jgi:hypothetical protein
MTHPERDPRMHDLDFLIGSWDVDHRRLMHRLAGANEWEHFTGTTVCRKVLDGVGNVDEITMPALGSVGMTVRSFEHASGLCSLHWASCLTRRVRAARRRRLRERNRSLLRRRRP